MISKPSRSVRRSGVATMELVCVLPLLLLLIFGIWDVGRMVEVQQLMSNAAREGAHQAAVCTTLDETTGTERDITTSDVQQTVLNYLTRNGVNTNGATVQFSNLDNPGAGDPYQAQHLEHLRVTVQLPFNNVRWTLLNTFTSNNLVLTGSADWYCLKDVNVNVSTILPTN